MAKNWVLQRDESSYDFFMRLLVKSRLMQAWKFSNFEVAKQFEFIGLRRVVVTLLQEREIFWARKVAIL